MWSRSEAQRAKERRYITPLGEPQEELDAGCYIPSVAVAPPARSYDIPQEQKVVAKPYKYRPLTDSGSYIRIFSLASGSDSEPLCGEIFTCPISKVVRYEALSYRWGEESKETDLFKAPNIRIGDEYLKITPSLHEALSILRFPNKRRPLWIDQVCIHQADGKEKEKQLPLMGKIYRQAQQALIWLGIPSEDDEAVLSIIQSYKPFWQQLEAMVGSELRATGIEATVTIRTVVVQELAMEDPDELLRKGITSVLDISHISSSQVPKILEFYNKSWFTRTWPVQEVVLSRIKTVHCGLIELEWAHVSYFANMFIHKFPHVNVDAVRARGLYAANQLHWWEQTYEGGFSLVELLRTIRNQEAGDDKDKVYGILNMVDYNLNSANEPFDPDAGKVSAIPSLLSPDCSRGKSALDVYHDVACYIMTREKSLDLLALVYTNGPPERRTWVPRWNVRERTTPLWVPGMGQVNFSASTNASGATFSLRSGKEGRLMETCNAVGIKIGDVENFPLAAPADNWSTEAAHDKYLAHWVSNELAADSKRFSWFKRSPSKELLTALAMTLTSGREHLATIIRPNGTEHHVRNFLAWVRGLSDLRADQFKEVIKLQKRLRNEKHWPIGSDLDGEVYGRVARTWCGRRAMFRTTSGMFVLGPSLPSGESVIIVILQGGKVPFMLRKDPDEAGCYNLVGACYAYGAMNNEFGDDLKGRLDRYTIV